jgi:hypothetical protein
LWHFNYFLIHEGHKWTCEISYLCWEGTKNWAYFCYLSVLNFCRGWREYIRL